MPRKSESPEARILAYFRYGPLAVASVVHRLAKDILKEREGGASTAQPAVTRAAPAPSTGSKRPMSAAQREHLRKAAKRRWAKIRKAAAAQPSGKNWTSPHTGSGKAQLKKKSHHKKKPQAGAVASGEGNGAEVEVFGKQD